MIAIQKVESKKDLKEFIDFPHKLYAEDSHYVPELFIAQRDLLTKHPFHKHSKLELFIAKKDGKTAGRIAAIRNNNYIKFSGNTEGFFGFFDVINDYEVASKLLETVSGWAKKENLKGLIGPVNFSTNETAGMLIEGFDSSPVVMMTYNKPYYNDFVARFGYGKKMDLLAYKISQDKVSEKVLRISSEIEERLKQKGIIIRKVNLKKYKEEAAKLKSIYNSAWESNWGFVPMTDEEFTYLANDLKLIINPDYTFIAEHDGKIIGFSLALPDVNYALKKVKNGRLLPFGIFNLLLNKNKFKMVRVLALGVIDGYRKMGIEACFYSRTILAGRKNGVHSAEASWILENNVMMNQGLQNMNGEVYKKYRIYEFMF